MKTMITGLFLSTLSLGFFFSTDIVSAVHAVTTSGGRTPGLTDDLDQGSLHKFYWLLAAISAVDLLAFVAVARGYVYKEKRLAHRRPRPRDPWRRPRPTPPAVILNISCISTFNGVILSSRLVLPIFNDAAYIYEAHVRRYFKISSYVSPSYSEHHCRVLQMTSLDACKSVERFINTHGPDALDRIIRAMLRSPVLAHVCKQSYNHLELGAAISWDDALRSGMRRFQHKYYNLFTCNCHSFVASCLNQIAYNGSLEWNVLNVAALVWFHGRWVDRMSTILATA
ncbi:hypothetical protein ZEAMMB73_Zm00001d004376 [Zea mays]|uniref:Uncharacterized protein n=1 Tax=Zea mays TaxID=4577 RepID=A0A1D6EF05_MAIZE|nr:hypothetical protein ZEAMMB73_Zm00001d004376 [Zea mays]